MNVDGLGFLGRTRALYRDGFEFVLVVFARFPERFGRLIDQIRHHRRPTGRRDFRVIGDVF